MTSTTNPRICGKKVKTGCLTCKARHLKCDEETPQCRRCSTSGRTCGGYRESTPTGRHGRLIIIHYTPQMPAVPGSAISQNSKEQRSFAYFKDRTAADLLASFSSELWSSYVLQLAQAEPAIRHAVIAIGSAHEHFESSSNSLSVASSFALRQYSTAVQHIIRSLQNVPQVSADIALLSSALFALCESLLGHYRSAMIHISSGMKVLEEPNAGNHALHGSRIPEGLLNSLFCRLGTQLLEIGDVSFSPGRTLKRSLIPQPYIPPRFSTLEEAQDTFNSYLYRIHRFLEFVGSTDTARTCFHTAETDSLLVQQAQTRQSFKQWSASFDEYLSRELRLSPLLVHSNRVQVPPGVYILQIWRRMMAIFLFVNFTADEAAWDPFVDDFRLLVDVAETFVHRTTSPIQSVSSSSRHATSTNQLHTEESMQTGDEVSSNLGKPSQPSILGPARRQMTVQSSPDIHRFALDETNSPNSNSTSTIKPTFSMSLGIIPPLYMTGTRCRHPAVRRKAIRLLSLCNRREGIWDSRLSAKVANRVMEIEESGAREHIRSLNIDAGVDRAELLEITTLEQIPASTRVRHLQTSFGPERQGIVRYVRGNAGATGPDKNYEMFEETLSW
jgi:Fungal Zn(2)-Cys(6) binuclear cluster domain/Fungal specific transcription factor domain